MKTSNKSMNSILSVLIIVAVIAGSLLANSDEVNAESVKKPKGTAITYIKQKNNKAITIKYKKSKYAKKYEIAYKISGTKKYKYKVSTKRKVTLKDLKFNKIYRIKVRAINGEKKGKWSSIKSSKSALKEYAYLLRPVTITRKNMVGLYAEPENSLDMIYVGNSTTYRSWSPIQAWDKYGFTSYSYSTPGMPASILKYMVAESIKNQNPKLVVINVAPFLIRETYPPRNISFLKYASNGLEYSNNRTSMINSFVKYEQPYMSQSMREMILDDIQLHQRREHSLDSDSYKYQTNRVKEKYKGFRIGYPMIYTKGYEYDLENITETPPLQSDTDKLLNELLSYIERNDLNVIFAFAPRVLNEEDKKCLNTIEKIITDRGHDYFDGMDHIDEMDLDFETDFYDKKHMNSLGGTKYTDYFAKYIDSEYRLPDHRSEDKYLIWNRYSELYEPAIKKNNREIKKIIIDQ